MSCSLQNAFWGCCTHFSHSAASAYTKWLNTDLWSSRKSKLSVRCNLSTSSVAPFPTVVWYRYLPWNTFYFYFVCFHICLLTVAFGAPSVLYVNLNHACSVCGFWLVKCYCFLFVVLRFCFLFPSTCKLLCNLLFDHLGRNCGFLPKGCFPWQVSGCQKAFIPPGSSVARTDARNCWVVGMPAADVMLLIQQGHSSGWAWQRFRWLWLWAVLLSKSQFGKEVVVQMVVPVGSLTDWLWAWHRAGGSDDCGLWAALLTLSLAKR